MSPIATRSGSRCSARISSKCCAESGTERPYTSALNDEHRKGMFRCAGCELQLFSSDGQVRQRHGVAELLAAARERRRHDDRPKLRHGAQRRALPALRRPSRPRLRRRAETDGFAVLHQRARTHSSCRCDGNDDAAVRACVSRRRAHDREPVHPARTAVRVHARGRAVTAGHCRCSLAWR